MLRSFGVLALASLLLSACNSSAAGTPNVPAYAGPALHARAASGYTVMSTLVGGSKGQYPWGGLLVTQAGASQILYGTTENGGLRKPCNYLCGTVWRAVPGAPIVPIYAFKGASDGEEPLGYPVSVKGTLYGTTSGGGAPHPPSYGLIYKLAIVNGVWTKSNVHVFDGKDGSGPQQLALVSASKIVGTSANGVQTANCCGNVFSVNTDGSQFTVIHSFSRTRASQGETPAFGALAYDARTGAIYGETQFGGHFDNAACYQGCGVLFKLTPNGPSYTFNVMYTFKNATDGALPNGGLTLVDDGKTATLYGNAASGGIDNCGTSVPEGCGTVFSYSDPGGFSTIYMFKGAQPEYGDAVQPENSLAYANGHLYGTSLRGELLPSGFSYGAIFDVDVKAKSDTVLHFFTNYPKDGGVPEGGPTLARTGKGLILYGSTFQGGSSKACPGGGGIPTGCGTLWSYPVP